MRGAAVLAAAAFLLFAGCTFEQPEHRVEYRVTGTARSVEVALTNADGGTEMYDNRALPWTYTVSGNYQRGFLYISAQNEGERGSVTASIYVDGQQWKTATSSGEYVIATASGRL